jgi:mono/diheme cytochrome c family protein
MFVKNRAGFWAMISAAGMTVAAIAAPSASAMQGAPAAQAAPAAGAADAEGEMFKRHCSVCHGLDVVTAFGRSGEEWREVVQRMVEQNGAMLTEPERDAVIAYLVKTHGKDGAAAAPAGTPAKP